MGKKKRNRERGKSVRRKVEQEKEDKMDRKRKKKGGEMWKRKMWIVKE